MKRLSAKIPSDLQLSSGSGFHALTDVIPPPKNQLKNSIWRNSIVMYVLACNEPWFMLCNGFSFSYFFEVFRLVKSCLLALLLATLSNSFFYFTNSSFFVPSSPSKTSGILQFFEPKWRSFICFLIKFFSCSLEGVCRSGKHPSVQLGTSLFPMGSSENKLPKTCWFD